MKYLFSLLLIISLATSAQDKRQIIVLPSQDTTVIDLTTAIAVQPAPAPTVTTTYQTTVKKTTVPPVVVVTPPISTVPIFTVKPTAIQNTINSFARATGASITETTYLGEAAIKYTVAKTDPLIAGGRRSESVGLGGQTVSEKWIINRVAIPLDHIDEDTALTVVIFQMHDDNWVKGVQGPEFHSPFDIVVAGKNWLCNVRYGNVSEIGKSFVLAPVVKGKYVEFGVHLKFTKDGSPGIQQIWMDGKLVLDQKLPMGYTHGFQPYYKQGVYAWAMNDDSQAKYLKAAGYTSYFAAHEEWDNISVKPF